MSDFNAKMRQIRFPLRLRSRPSIAGFKAPTSKGREAKMEGRGGLRVAEKMRALLLRNGKKEVDRREGREEEGICRTNVKVLLPTPLAKEHCLGACLSL